MFKNFTSFCVALISRWLPDAFLFCAALTFLVFLGGMGITGQSAMQMLNHWHAGFWELLSFSMQMALVLITGHTLASSQFFKGFLSACAKMIKTPAQAIIATTLISSLACLFNWGFGLVIGAIFAKEIARNLKTVDYRLLIAAAYSGFLLWHGGLSGSIPLQIASADVNMLAEQTAGGLRENIPTSQSIFSSLNIFIVIALLIALPLINWAMYPKQSVCVDPELLREDPAPQIEPKTPAERAENSRIISLLLGIMGMAVVVYYFAHNGFNLTLNIVNFILLFSAILLHKTPIAFIRAFNEAARGASGILLQFPFYAGIMGMMVGANADGTSLASWMSKIFVEISTPDSFAIFSFLSAGLVNFFVPSGGGQWVVQAPIILPAAAELGVPAAKAAMAIAWGDAWTNMIQPFWALPALAIAGLSAKDIMGYCLVILILSGVIISAGFYFF